jgi:hypothetical protein
MCTDNVAADRPSVPYSHEIQDPLLSFGGHENIEQWSLDNRDMSISCRTAIPPQAAELPPNGEEGGLHIPQGTGILYQPSIGLKRLESQLLESTKKWKVGVGLKQWETKTISLKYLKLGKSRKKLKWLMNISAIDNKH